MRCSMVVGFKCTEDGEPGDEIECDQAATHIHEGDTPCCAKCAEGLIAEGFKVIPIQDVL